MLRRTLTIFSLLGLLLSVGLWGASYLYVIGYLKPSISYAIVSAALVVHHRTPDGLRLDDLSEEKLAEPMHWRFRRHEVSFSTAWMPLYSVTIYSRHMVLPLWMPTIIFASLCWYCCRQVGGRRKRQKLGLCVKCGYDLRGSKERCPECGARFETSKLDADC